jgi:hypothetical protein
MPTYYLLLIAANDIGGNGLDGHLLIDYPFHFGTKLEAAYLKYLAKIRNISVAALPFLDIFFPELCLQSSREATRAVASCADTYASTSGEQQQEQQQRQQQQQQQQGAPQSSQREGGKGPRELTGHTTGTVEQRFTAVKSPLSGVLPSGREVRVDTLAVRLCNFMDHCHKAVVHNWHRLARDSHFSKQKPLKARVTAMATTVTSRQAADVQRVLDEVRCVECFNAYGLMSKHTHDDRIHACRLPSRQQVGIQLSYTFSRALWRHFQALLQHPPARPSVVLLHPQQLWTMTFCQVQYLRCWPPKHGAGGRQCWIQHVHCIPATHWTLLHHLRLLQLEHHLYAPPAIKGG